jgi:hypothetical protein
MDIGMFSYWWTGVAGTFSARTIAETGIDQPFIVACVVLGLVLMISLTAIVRLRSLRKD